ncbi:MAG: hypothetical protein K8L91_01630 [Anaerolineae bacterium]|nr:hypothetical protein [Anaerolineae bacterium]
MAGYICINCNSRDVTRSGDDFFCDRCKFKWDVAHEQACAIYLRGQGREPAKSMAEMTAEASEALIETMGEDGAALVTPSDPGTPPVVNEQEATDSKPESTAKKNKAG